MKTNSIKTIIAGTFLLAIVSAAGAQKSDFKMETLAKQKKTVVTGYGGLLVSYTRLGRADAANFGAYGGALINHKWLIGAATQNILFRRPIEGANRQFDFCYLGVYSEYHFSPAKLVHVVAGIQAGPGIVMHSTPYVHNGERDWDREGRGVLVVEPNLGLALNVNHFMRLHTRVSYRFCGDPKSDFVGADDLRKLNVGIGFVFGKF